MPTGATDVNYLPTLPLSVPEAADPQMLPAIVRDLVILANHDATVDASATGPTGNAGPTGPTGNTGSTGNPGPTGLVNFATVTRDPGVTGTVWNNGGALTISLGA